jgi:long-chain fatty acid transport protein
MWIWGASAAWAGGYFYSDSGVVPLGRGGAWIASADTQFAQRYNPAGLIRIEDLTISLGLNEVQQRIAFTRAATEDQSFDRVENEASPYEVPEGGVVVPIAEGLVGALGFTSPFAPSSLYPSDGPQRYSIIDTGIYQFTVGASLAWRPKPTPWLTVGATFQWNYLQVNEALAVTINGSDDPAADIDVTARVTEPFLPNANVGLLVEPLEQLSFGLCVQPPVAFEAHGPLTLDFTGITFGDGLDEAVYTDDDVSLSISLPLEVKAGVAVRPVDRLEFEFATVYQAWSTLEDILIEDVDIALDVKDEPIWDLLIPADQRKVDDSFTLPAGLRDTVSLRLGGELQATDGFAVRAGGFWESGAFPDSLLSVALVDTDKVQLGAGATGWLADRRLRLDGGLAWLFLPTQTVTNSEVTQVDAGVIPGTVPLVVGNGIYESHGWIAGAGLSWAFRKPSP